MLPLQPLVGPLELRHACLRRLPSLHRSLGRRQSLLQRRGVAQCLVQALVLGAQLADLVLQHVAFLGDGLHAPLRRHQLLLQGGGGVCVTLGRGGDFVLGLLRLGGRGVGGFQLLLQGGHGGLE